MILVYDCLKVAKEGVASYLFIHSIAHFASSFIHRWLFSLVSGSCWSHGRENSNKRMKEVDQ